MTSTTTRTRHFAVQLMVGASWTTIGAAEGANPYEAFATFADGKASGGIDTREPEFGFARYDIGGARFRLVPCRKGETVI